MSSAVIESDGATTTRLVPALTFGHAQIAAPPVAEFTRASGTHQLCWSSATEMAGTVCADGEVCQDAHTTSQFPAAGATVI